MPEMLWQMAEEGITMLWEYILERKCYVRPENPSDIMFYTKAQETHHLPKS